MGKTTVQSVADDLDKLTQKQMQLVNFMRAGLIGRRPARDQLKKIRDDIGNLVGRLGSM